ncbi:MAG TPA: Asp-tRNA(Asn)/Glu-tRNA(Gln) amidotransferase subunit GatC [Candidatus Pygmaiobacter gallistercoris]|nr:Asp-tRNA(Asn)/Glu-tRNA(Gln) amidotransferase subunit GatC [Candidatus Pygmaiobacter gallistercoris]
MEIDVRHIAKLAKLEIPEDQIPKMEQELSSIVSMVEKLPELVSKESLLDRENTMELRPDVVRPSFARDEMLKNAPDTAAGCLMVPKVVE